MPSRIAFSVSSGVDSRTIIDMNGAEKLLGKGDMLFYPAGYQKPARVQGAFVSDKEVQAVVDFLVKNSESVQYNEEITNHVNSASVAAGGTVSGNSGADDRDAYFVDAGKFIIEKDKASIGMLQRVFKIGFNRAARIMDQLEEAGIVGPEEGTKPRRVLMTQEQFEQYEEAVGNNDTAVFETAKGEVVEAIRHSNYRINGSIIFDLALVVADIIVIVLLSIVINKSIVRPAKRAKNDLDDIILGIESGQGNLTLRVFDETSDEIGQLANGVNHFIETLQNLMVKIQSVSKDMKKSSYLVQNEAESSNMSASNVSATSEELAASMEEVSASLYDLAQGCNNLLEKMAGMNEDAKNSAMKMHEVKLTAENSYKEAIASKEKTVETFDGIHKDVAEAVEASKSVNEIVSLLHNANR